MASELTFTYSGRFPVVVLGRGKVPARVKDDSAALTVPLVSASVKSSPASDCGLAPKAFRVAYPVLEPGARTTFPARSAGAVTGPSKEKSIRGRLGSRA